MEALSLISPAPETWMKSRPKRRKVDAIFFHATGSQNDISHKTKTLKWFSLSLLLKENPFKSSLLAVTNSSR